MDDAVAELPLDEVEAELEVVVHAPLGRGQVLGEEVPAPRARGAVEEGRGHAVVVAEHGRVEVRRRPEAEHGEAGGGVLGREGAREGEEGGELVRRDEAGPARRVVGCLQAVAVVDE